MTVRARGGEYPVRVHRGARRARCAVGLSDRAGLLVETVGVDGPACAAGLLTGDLLVGVDGRPRRSCVDLGAASHDASRLHLRVLRGEEELSMTMTRRRT